MLNRDPERHVGLMPVQYGVESGFSETGKLSQYQQMYDQKKAAVSPEMLLLSSDTGKVEGLIERETRSLLQRSDSSKNHHHHRKSVKGFSQDTSAIKSHYTSKIPRTAEKIEIGN